MELPTCPICLESLDKDLIATKCGHVYHEVCLFGALRQSQKCPLCARVVKFETGLTKIWFEVRMFNENPRTSPGMKGKKLLEESMGETVAELRAQVHAKSEKLGNIQREMEELRTEYDKLAGDYKTLQTKKADLQEELDTARENYHSINRNFQSKIKEAAKLRDRNKALETAAQRASFLDMVDNDAYRAVEEFGKTQSKDEIIRTICQTLTAKIKLLNREREARKEDQGELKVAQAQERKWRKKWQALRKVVTELSEEKEALEAQLSRREVPLPVRPDDDGSARHGSLSTLSDIMSQSSFTIDTNPTRKRSTSQISVDAPTQESTGPEEEGRSGDSRHAPFSSGVPRANKFSTLTSGTLFKQGYNGSGGTTTIYHSNPISEPPSKRKRTAKSTGRKAGTQLTNMQDYFSQKS